jgi:glutathione S-transferase
MKLFLNAASPYARLVRLVLLETGLHAATELHFVDPWESPPHLLAHNPASKVPVLLLDDGASLMESGCICDYLIAISQMPRMAASLQDLVPGKAPSSPVDLADLTLAVALEYVEFRLSELGWSQHCPQLFKWSAQMGQRPSLSATRPQ